MGPEDLEVTLAVRRDLGADNERAVIAEFLNRLGSAIDDRVDARVEARTSALSRSRSDRQPSIALGVTSVVLVLPISSIVLGTTKGSVGGMIVMIITLAAITAVNFAYARRR
ncbi:MAG: hypothetical protein J2P20_13200 [Pseudonocardia sp.]|nr:hypothetical protein [Pseudonocardia sp.]